MATPPTISAAATQESPPSDADHLLSIDSDPDTNSSSPISISSDSSDSSSSSSSSSGVSRSIIASLPTIQISDPSLTCAICKDEFLPSPSPSASQLPCAHVYHHGCIVPWLSRRNSCPLCRSRLPSPRRSPRPRRRARLSSEGEGLSRFLVPERVRAMLIESVRENLRAVLERMPPVPRVSRTDDGWS